MAAKLSKAEKLARAMELRRKDRDAPERRVLTDALGNIAAMGYSDDPAVSQRIARYAVEMARQAREEYFALTPAPAAPNTAPPPACQQEAVTEVVTLGLALIEQDELGGKAGWDAFATALRALEGQG